ncbi:(Fe-S)-binding protein [Marisediminicola antarctica]|uniref:hypothetical protein n=1 Tax=Marisediminicola antarctica TaxID=674079 RepID=UPI001F39329E|nr:hypothetical protein [Marisediminicola antarctica]
MGYDDMVEKTLAALWAASDSGRMPVVCDNSSCSEGLVVAAEKAAEKHPEFHPLRIVDAVDFAAEHVLPHIDITDRLETLAVHPTCSSTRAGSNANLNKLARSVAASVIVPDAWGCCAFADDRGMLHPELTASATAAESTEIEHATFDAYVSCNRTCEIGITRATGHPYQHILKVLDRLTAPAIDDSSTPG